MTGNDDNLNDDPSISAQALLHQEELIDDEFTDDDALEAGAGDFEVNSGDLTPNDIFGLDPLDVLTLEELADYLKVSPAAVRRAIKDEKLPGRNIGGEWRFLRDAVANWLRCQEAPIVQQQQARESFSQAKPKHTSSHDEEQTQYTRPPRRPYQSGQSEGGEYRPRQRFSEGQYPYGNQGSGNQGGSYQGNAYRGGQQGDRTRRDNVADDQGATGEYEARPPRRPFRSYEGRGEGNSQGNAGQSGNGGGYRAGGQPFTGGQQFSGGSKRRSKRQVFDNERGKRMDRRKENGTSEGQE